MLIIFAPMFTNIHLSLTYKTTVLGSGPALSLRVLRTLCSHFKVSFIKACHECVAGDSFVGCRSRGSLLSFCFTSLLCRSLRKTLYFAGRDFSGSTLF